MRWVEFRYGRVRLAREKVLAVKAEPNDIVLCADTTVALAADNPGPDTSLFEGNVVQHSSTGKVRRNRIDIEPIKAFLEDGAELHHRHQHEEDGDGHDHPPGAAQTAPLVASPLLFGPEVQACARRRQDRNGDDH